MTSDVTYGGRSNRCRDDGFVGGLEVAVFTAVIVSVMLTVVELFGLLLARDELLRLAQFGVAQLADQVVSEATLIHDPAFVGYSVSMTSSDDPCPVVTVTLTGSYDGVVTGRAYALTGAASQIVTAYRDFSIHHVPDDTC
ncbi:MAG: hypothetical protein WD360_04385 [Nitriliruptoraceae bacterium]